MDVVWLFSLKLKLKKSVISFSWIQIYRRLQLTNLPLVYSLHAKEKRDLKTILTEIDFASGKLSLIQDKNGFITRFLRWMLGR